MVYIVPDNILILTELQKVLHIVSDNLILTELQKVVAVAQSNILTLTTLQKYCLLLTK